MTEHRYPLTLYTLQGTDGCWGAEIVAGNGKILIGVSAEHTAEADAAYQALHGLAVQNNFSGCLKAALSDTPETTQAA